ncbi:flagellar biosynthesis anti-sigma factor FlgM [Mitsuaria sp. TWR114]|jgi:negative regulator of flagellin synthesis FlgM|uniref:flagellar biosynthesis anti-sigma factor FlgM n=1 Tax=unclassified Roseateles TaxID=2626991 RepID=UPI0008E5DEC7|nr:MULTISPECIES: flagellar biosynthesis anti-sigma factor FlgM [unclassified Roseateles]MBB3292236.1 negative regulator of flagellin synthesis FlgM [Mitsuaria sp. BK041]MBB3361453.1 negative regulator of flagellin synthesis FlgM [Mitsuaria sp. BK045]TXE00502.1 flagellar biosynthesis anti-sigma factor FlgM [Mitsuaria sp. TWR114]SFR73959.1 anti-sigma-28 factor, FlgM family [Mitsuaria sp. PDC51]
MKIGNNADLNAYSKVGGTTTGTPEAGAAKAGKAGTAASGEGSKVELSSAASSLIAGAPDDGSFDAEKVARIASAIEKGEFKINADAIADKLIANAAEMLGRTQPSH